ncbi:FkbM family methyltransferase [Puniceibacterium confluentis]|uniref:FkbM family methyltransferase n=1 Tax=Puniceibacterium confluentis TaxID=1958944 RepID=UPI0011B58782|nr:FkbM family methyltransferase [Puniceibacterium confluentis]
MAKRNTLLRRLKYRILQTLPGNTGLRYRRKYLKLFAGRAEAQMRAALAAAPGGICIDLGANVGQHTRTMAAHAGMVYAFEPDPWTAARLRENLADLGNVTVIEAAAGTENGSTALFRTAEFNADPEMQSQSSSIVAEKRNVDTAHPVKVQVLDFTAFLEALDSDIAVLKMDIEGAEVALLEKLFDHPVLSRIGHVFVETHESRIPELAPRSEALRRRSRNIAHPVINMDWK